MVGFNLPFLDPDVLPEATLLRVCLKWRKNLFSEQSHGKDTTFALFEPFIKLLKEWISKDSALPTVCG